MDRFCTQPSVRAQRGRAFSSGRHRDRWKVPNIRSHIDTITEMLRGSRLEWWMSWHREFAKHRSYSGNRYPQCVIMLTAVTENAPTAKVSGWMGNRMP